ncbi:MetQ/NlpA family ABC transporter substrate-binding protein [Corynebacterium belfantii]|uniref:MetQ/NlpA family ABC transporter substrate-binding protein n=1 Tax=Corynebacterium belfantii TaxID=2014537 RepID=UPI00095C3127|nr:MetQ/NlpA family ABC transporter substrate-binding protein [Corynebacterium belfantii]OLN15260.1 methionine ABC transporter substrate-binding protein [Corynebacterium diphtheriae subsp. lausannense]QVI97522.1 methionine ABC transporter substrate-binding protein [Corynebacterium diphtheriae]MBG9244433.1 methionine ABC transporter substrate-binding protein [Corynebacterium belfantii]MBG9259506.1 methionine ABC transporter substrate-binding protein [Corynebacterium belfantii]MBG9266269.1 methi
MNFTKFRTALSILSVTVVAATGLAACSGGSSDANTIKIGTTDSTKKAWDVWKDKAKEQGIDLEVVDFSDFSTPNQALSQNRLDVNLFQHLKFLAEYNVKSKSDLAPVGSTEIIPLALFWKGHDSLDGIEGQSVAIPNDPTNQARAINVLVANKLITLKKPGLSTPTPADVDTAKSKVTLTPVEAASSPAAYGEGKPAIINNTFLERSGIDAKTAIVQDDPASTEAEPYINVMVTTKENKDNPQWAQLIELWHTDEVQKALAEDSKGTSVEVKRSPEELQAILDRLEAEVK